MNLKSLTKNNLLFFILFIGFLLRIFYFYYNDDAQVYVLWLKHFINTGELLSFDHPPTFFIVSAILVKTISTLLSFGIVIYWLTAIIVLILLYKIERIKTPLKLIISIVFLYIWFVGFYLETYEIATTVSLLFGIIAICLVYKLGEFFFNKNVGIMASLFLSSSWWHIIYSQIPLIDCFATTLILWGIYEYTKFLEKNKFKIEDLLFPTISLTLAFYSKYYSLLIIPSILFLLFLKFRKKRNFVYALPLLISLVIFSFWFIYTKFYLSQHYAISHYFFLEFPSKTAFITFFVKCLTPPIFFLFIFSFLIFTSHRKYLEKNCFLLSLIFVPLIVYFKSTYLDGASHTLINLSNYMLPTLPFIYLFISSQLNFIENRFNVKLIGALSIILFTTLVFMPKNYIFLEYDKNYKTVRGNLDSLGVDEINKLSIRLPTLHYVYSFTGLNIFQANSAPKLTVHYRWSSPDKLMFYSLEEKRINLTLFVKPFCNTSLTIRYKGFENEIFISAEGELIEIPLELSRGMSFVRFESNNNCICLNKKCTNFLIEDRGYRAII